ncbi:MAG: sulfotransferase domain-containing protein [Microcoleaceae cyanobacterium]
MTNAKYGIFVHALHKSATMFLYKLFKDLSEELSLSYYSLNNKPVHNHNDLKEDIDQSFCYCPVRHFADSSDTIPSQFADITPVFFVQDNTFINIPNIYRIYQIRDPRDILVSQYFSFGFIHGGLKTVTKSKLKIQNMTVDEYCLDQADSLAKKYDNILNIYRKNNPKYLIVQYESMVLDYKKWLSEIISLLPFQDKADNIEKYYNKYREEFEAEGFEESMQHKRKMIPGDYKEKLEEPTIIELNSKFSDILDSFYSE